MTQFQIPIRPQATPMNQFYQPTPDTRELMKSDRTLQLANALVGIRPELQRIADQRFTMYQGAGDGGGRAAGFRGNEENFVRIQRALMQDLRLQ